jgi:hypothetical protein
MRKVMVWGLVLLALAGAATAATWKSFTAPDKKFSIDFPGDPTQMKEQQGIQGWAIFADMKAYTVTISTESGIKDLDAGAQDKALLEFAANFFQGAEVTTTNQKSISGGYEFTGTITEDKDRVNAQVLKDAPNDRVYILMTFGEAESQRFFDSFKKL